MTPTWDPLRLPWGFMLALWMGSGALGLGFRREPG